jgi:hypothetical protein
VSDPVVVELQRPAERLDHLLGGVLVEPLLEPHVVVGAHPGQHRHLLAAQTGDAAPAEVGEADVSCGTGARGAHWVDDRLQPFPLRI